MIPKAEFTPLRLADYETLAQPRLSGMAQAYFCGGAGEELGLEANLAAWRRWRLVPRALNGRAVGGGTAVRLFGMDVAHPFIVAPMALQRLAHPEGEAAVALAAAAQAGVMTVATEASMSIEAIARTTPGPLWFQLYPRHEWAQSLALVRRAENAGCAAIVVTVDAPLTPPRVRELRAGLRLPDGIAPVHLSDLAPPSLPRLEDGDSAVFDRLLAIAPAWDDIARLREATRLPLLLKGILNPADARRAVGCGADGIVVSNHGGRLLDSLPTGLEMLPEIAAAVAGAIPLIVDGGVRRGEDAVIARALGAEAVMVGRPVLHGLAVAGAKGASHVLRMLRDELEVAMALLGLRSLAEVRADMLRRA
ncbi:MAG: alpha-hydroxy-acid oxidizing protein [Alphaproteobacteria bacterium]|nr:alpha-hydroxy-acid oxidizing protein [Alphaproteobacteria bacterium]